MCKHCNKKSCSGECCSDSPNSSMLPQNAGGVNSNSGSDLPSGLSYLAGRCPTQWLWHPDDIACFDLNTGVGSGVFLGHAVMNGGNYKTPSGVITVPNLMGRFPMGASLAHPAGSFGGAETIKLAVGQLPKHTPVITADPHNHVVNDPGHAHPTEETAHTHVASQAAHGHTGNTSTDGGHGHTAPAAYTGLSTGGNDAQFFVFPPNGTPTTLSTSIDGNHQHNVTVDEVQPAVTVNGALTGVAVESAFTGLSLNEASVTVQAAEIGNDEDVNILNPFVSGLWVTKLF